jgi:hypothetical protein
MTEPTAETPGQRVEARAATDPAVRLFILAAMLLGFSAWCILDRKPLPQAWDLEHINEVASFLTNNVMPFFLVPGGLVALVWGVVFLRRRLVADAEGIGYAGKDKVPWHAVRKVDASQLQSKGILDLYHGEEEKKLRLDSWKLKSFKPLIAFVEAHLPTAVLQEAGLGGGGASEDNEDAPGGDAGDARSSSGKDGRSD